jgi:hypothetical protein
LVTGFWAGRDGAAAALALRAELARRASQPAEVLLPGTARRLVETALASGLRLTRPPGLLSLSGGADPPQALQFQAIGLFEAGTMPPDNWSSAIDRPRARRDLEEVEPRWTTSGF